VKLCVRIELFRLRKDKQYGPVCSWIVASAVTMQGREYGIKGFFTLSLAQKNPDRN
jgi:hypothetical protein